MDDTTTTYTTTTYTTTSYTVGGMTCGHCASSVTAELSALPANRSRSRSVRATP